MTTQQVDLEEQVRRTLVSYEQDEQEQQEKDGAIADLSLRRPRMSWQTFLGMAVSAVLVLAVLGGAPLRKSTPAAAAALRSGGASIWGALGQLEEIDSAQAGWQIHTTERDLCTGLDDNCFHTKCCKITNYHCYKQNDTYAECKKSQQDREGEILARKTSKHIKVVDFKKAKSLFCFAVYTQNSGSYKKSNELEILTYAYAMSWHVFGCDAYEVYSDVVVSLGEDYSTKQVHDVDGTFRFARRKETGAWINTGMFQQVWKAIDKAGTYKSYDWTVKADADAVFLPSRLVKRIEHMPRATTGVFLTNCKQVDYGFFGSLEVFSEIAFSVLLVNLDKCNKTLPWTVGIKNGTYGPMGEDLFAEICMEKNGVFKMEAFDLKVDGSCPGDRPLDQKKNKKWTPSCAQTFTPAMHPFKKTSEWMKCYKDTKKAEALYMTV